MPNISLSTDPVVHRKPRPSAPEDASVRQSDDFSALLKQTGEKADDHNQLAQANSDPIPTVSSNMAGAQEPRSATVRLEDLTGSSSSPSPETQEAILSPDALPQDTYPTGGATASPTELGVTLRASGDNLSQASDGLVKPGQPLVPSSGSAVIRTLARGMDNGTQASIADAKQNPAGLSAKSPLVPDAQTMPQGYRLDGRLILSGVAQPRGHTVRSTVDRLAATPPFAVAPTSSPARLRSDVSSSVTPYAFATNPESSQRYSTPGRLAETLTTGTRLQSVPVAVTAQTQSATGRLSMLNPKDDRPFGEPTGLLLMGAADGPDSTIGPSVSSQGGGAPTVSALVPAVATAQNSAIQVAQAISNATHDSFDIVLAPEELGRVRIYLQPSDTGLQVVIATERPETLELLRKNIASLARALSDLGHESTSFQFEQQGRGEGQGHFVARQEGRAAGAVSEQAEELMPVTSQQTLTTGMDLRF